MADERAPGDPPDLNPVLNARALPSDVAHRRELAADVNARYAPVVAVRIAASLADCKLALLALERHHAHIADGLDLDLCGYSRPAALWAISGRCLGLLRAVLTLVEAGICHEIVPEVRALHEATQLLFAVTLPEEDALLRKWLDDAGQFDYVKAGQSRKVHERLQPKLAEAMIEAGVEPDVPDVMAASAQMYDALSRSGHNRRGPVVAAISEPLRQMAIGYDPDPLERATFARLAVTTALEVVHFVGDALSLFHGGEPFMTAQIQPLLDRIEATLAAHPLDHAAIIDASSAA